MSKQSIRFVARAVDGTGWRIWDRIQKKWWGNAFREYPRELLSELNGLKRPDRLVKLNKQQ